MKFFLHACALTSIFFSQTSFAQTTYLTDEELTKEFDRDVVYITNTNTKITHSKGGGIELNGSDVRGRPTYDSGKFSVKEGKYCTRWVKTRANEEACFFISKREGEIVFHTLDGKEAGTRREPK
jgi:hypothetical protein